MKVIRVRDIRVRLVILMCGSLALGPFPDLVLKVRIKIRIVQLNSCRRILKY